MYYVGEWQDDYGDIYVCCTPLPSLTCYLAFQNPQILSLGCRAKAEVLLHYPPPVAGRLCQMTREGEGVQGDFGPETRWMVEKRLTMLPIAAGICTPLVATHVGVAESQRGEATVWLKT